MKIKWQVLNSRKNALCQVYLQKTIKTSIMQRLFFIVSILYPFFSLAGSTYQVDLLLFAYPQNAINKTELAPNIPFALTNPEAIPLNPEQTQSIQPFHLLKSSAFGLNDELYRLNHDASYQVLGHYSWRQPITNKKTIVLPITQLKGWQVQGSVRVQHSNYYEFDAQLHCSPPSNPDSSFSLTQKQRLQDGKVYYFDHPQIGMLVKIHK